MEVMIGLVIAAGVLLGFGTAIFFWAWMLFECRAYEPRDGLDRTLWTATIAMLLPPVGAVLYYAVRRPLRMVELGE